jgi:hypothetical protein
MARRISLAPYLTIEEIEGRYRSTTDPVERSRWHFQLSAELPAEPGNPGQGE